MELLQFLLSIFFNLDITIMNNFYFLSNISDILIFLNENLKIWQLKSMNKDNVKDLFLLEFLQDDIKEVSNCFIKTLTFCRKDYFLIFSI